MKRLLRGELIGLEVRVSDSTHPGWIGIQGRVVDETRNMLFIEAEGKVKKIPKDTCRFEFRINSRWLKVDGKLLVGRPEDRIKKKIRSR